MPQSTRPHQFIISGFHRSGTSLTAQYLHRAGLNPGDNLLGANPSNPVGHFEDKDFLVLHKDILAANHRDWFTPGPDLSVSAASFQTRAKALLNQFPTDESIGFKGPRISLFLPWWHQQLNNPAAVIVYCHYAGFFHSLRNRQAQNLVFAPSKHHDALFFWQQPALALELWLSYNNAILDYVKAHLKTTLLVSYHSMLNGFNLPAVINLALGLGLALDTQCVSGIRPGVGHIPRILDNIDTALEERLEATLESLNALCCSEPEPAGRTGDVDSLASMHIKAPTHTPMPMIEQWFDQLHIPLSTNESLLEPKLSKHQRAASPGSVAGFAEHSEDVRELIEWARKHQANQCENAAEACCLDVRNLAPGNVSALYQLALLARNRGENRKAALLMYAAIQLNPEHAGIYYHLASALKDCEKSEQAMNMARHGLALQHDHCNLHLLQLELLLPFDNQSEARNACNNALLLFPDDAGFMKIMFRLAGDARDLKTAMAWFRRTVLAHIRKENDYRQTPLQAMKRVAADQQSALSFLGHRGVEQVEV